MSVYGNRIVWLDSRNGHRDIYLYNLSTHEETPVTVNTSVLEQPAIYDDRIVYMGSKNGNYDIYMYNITTHKENQITTNESEQHDPAIYGDKIVWTDYRNVVETKFPVDTPTPDIYMYDLSTSKETRVTTSGSARNPSIYENRVVWEDWRNGNFDIYMRTLAPTSPTANFSANPESGNTPLSVQFTDLSEYAASISWDFENDGIMDSTDKNPVYMYTRPGNYTVNLTSSNENGIDSKTSKIKVRSISHTTQYAYITNYYSNNVSVIDTTTDIVTATVDIGEYPYGVAVSPDGTKVYVVNRESQLVGTSIVGTVSVIDASTNKVTATVNVGVRPLGVAVTPDGSKVYVANWGSNNVSVINTETNTVTASVSVGSHPVGVAVNPEGTKVYVTNRGTLDIFSNTVSVIDTTTNNVTATVIVGSNPSGIAVNPEGTAVFVANADSFNVSKIDTITNNVTASVNVGAIPLGVAITPDGKKVYVTNYGTTTVSVIDTATNTVIAIIDLGTNPEGIAVNPDGKKIFVANPDNDTVSVIDTVTDTVVATLNVGDTPVAFGQFISSTPVTEILPVAVPSANVTSGYIPLCVQFTDFSQNITSRSWDICNDGTIESTDASFVSEFKSEGTYPVKLTVSNESGTSSQVITINAQKKSSSDGSSGGSSSGGGSPEPAKNVKVKELCQAFITSGKNVNFDFTKNATAIVNLSFDSKKTVGKTNTIVEMLKNKSTLTPETPDGEVYNYLNIWVGNGGYGSGEDNLENAVINFRVEKSWVKDKNIDQSSIVLNRYSDKKWNELPTTLSGEDDKYLYFKAESPGFSPFAITGEATKETEIQPEVDINKSNGCTAENVEQTENKENTTTSDEKRMITPGFELFYGITGLFVISLYRRR